MAKGVYPREDTDERFWRQVELEDPIIPENGCMLWTGAKDRDGYGKFKAEGRDAKAHRWIYERLRGPILPGLQIDHLCRVSNCVNPDHLEPVSLRVNLSRGLGNTDKAFCIHGHEFTPENTYLVIKDGTQRRYCRACQREANRRFKRKKEYRG